MWWFSFYLFYSFSTQAKHQQDLERRSKQTTTAEKKLHKEITMKQEGDRKVFDLNRKKEYKANKERWKRELSMDESTPKRQRDLTLQSQKDNLKQHEAQQEQHMLQAQKQYIELEMRKFKRRRMIMLHELEDQLLRDVSNSHLSLIIFISNLCLCIPYRSLARSSINWNRPTPCCWNIMKRHRSWSIASRRACISCARNRWVDPFNTWYNDVTLITRLSLQINKQHDTELHNQKDYMDRIKKELQRKHALELRQQPKSLKVQCSRSAS